MDNDWTEEAARLLPCQNEYISSGCRLVSGEMVHGPGCLASRRPAVAAALAKADNAALVQGLEIAIEVCDGLPDGLDCTSAIAAEIAKRKENT